MRFFALLGWAIVMGLMVGVLLDLATFLAARHGPHTGGGHVIAGFFFAMAVFAAFTASGLVSPARSRGHPPISPGYIRLTR